MGRPTRKEDNINCPYCGAEQHGLYGSGSDCSSCGKYYKIGITADGFVSLWKVTANLKYRIIRETFRSDSEKVLKFIGENKGYFQETRRKRMTRNIVVKYASSIGMKPYKIQKFHRENGSNLSLCTIYKILNIKDNGK